MKNLIILVIFLLSAPKSGFTQNHTTVSNKWVRLKLDTTHNCHLKFLGVPISAIIIEGKKEIVFDFYHKYLGYTNAACALLTDEKCIDYLFESKMAFHMQDSSRGNENIVSVSAPSPSDFGRMLKASKSTRGGNPETSCDGDICVKICPSKTCYSYECGSYAIEICYDGKVSATIVAGNVNVTVP